MTVQWDIKTIGVIMTFVRKTYRTYLPTAASAASGRAQDLPTYLQGARGLRPRDLPTYLR